VSSDPSPPPAPPAAPPLPATAPPATCDLVVVGAGLVGLATARELLARRPGLRAVVLDKEAAIATHQSSHNSGVVHSGIYYAPGSLKARLAVAGARDLYAYCEQRGIRHERCGKLILATAERDLAPLAELERRGLANGVPGLRRIEAQEIARYEPHARGIAALHSPETGIADFPAVAQALAEDVLEAGGSIVTGCAVGRVTTQDGRVTLEHAAGRTVARRAVFCAGAWADDFAGTRAPGPDLRIIPFRGAYRTVRPEAAHLVRGQIYPVPDPELPFLGVHLSRGIDGSVHAGPTALMVAARDAYRLHRVVPRDLLATLAWPGTWRMARQWWRTGLVELRNAVSDRAVAAAVARLVPAIGHADLGPGPAGVRAQAVGRDGALIDDFVVSGDGPALHVRNAPSPAATSALALARLIADRAEEQFGLEPTRG
jgi:(S)-2-hydroxyglutarate dehydrogenase